MIFYLSLSLYIFEVKHRVATIVFFAFVDIRLSLKNVGHFCTKMYTSKGTRRKM